MAEGHELYKIAPPYPWGHVPRCPSGCWKPQVALNPTYIVFLSVSTYLYIQTHTLNAPRQACAEASVASHCYHCLFIPAQLCPRELWILPLHLRNSVQSPRIWKTPSLEGVSAQGLAISCLIAFYREEGSWAMRGGGMVDVQLSAQRKQAFRQ